MDEGDWRTCQREDDWCVDPFMSVDFVLMERLVFHSIEFRDRAAGLVSYYKRLSTSVFLILA